MMKGSKPPETGATGPGSRRVKWAGGERRIRAVAPVSEEVNIIMDFETTSATAIKQMSRHELLRVIDRLQEGNAELQEAAAGDVHGDSPLLA